MTERNQVVALVALADQTCEEFECSLMLVCKRVKFGGQVAVVQVISNDVDSARRQLDEKVRQWANAEVAACRDRGNPLNGRPVCVKRFSNYTTAEIGD